ncbi:Pyruvate-flavodoxin oxidoreductase [hydrothermal vent metagenome]|uniref:Pyruvate-flavodoxin oxidoreductase n=1 Tax=hydrothermal vent metagenome TaxID=652676 RepID=A0A3B1BDP0_9ZZZZ
MNSIAIRLYRRLFAASKGLKEDGVETVLDGNTAVAITEAGITGAAALGSTFPGDAANQAWRSEHERRDADAFGGLLTSCETDGPRGALAAAMGLAMSGGRATAFLSGQDIAAAQDLLRTAVNRHLPLVLHVESNALSGQGPSLGTGHEAIHLCADSGVFTLVATNVQEAVDFALIARRVAERALVPGLVALDGEQTARSLQNVRLASLELAEGFIGASDASIETPTDSQKMLFGDSRRQVPNWHDLDNPVMHGALQGAETYPLGAIGQTAFFEQHVSSILAEALTKFAELTGRDYASVSSHELGSDPEEWPHYAADDAKTVLVVQGSAIETAKAVADHILAATDERVGVVGIHAVRPFPAEELVLLLGGRQNVVVLERAETPLAGDAPLTREIRAAFDRAQENHRYGSQTNPGYPVMNEKSRPRLRTAIYGLGGQPVGAADLIALCEQVESLNGPRHYLGVDLAQSSSAYPKRKVMLDRLKRAYPDIATQGLSAKIAAPDLRPENALTIAVHRLTGQGSEGLTDEAGNYLHLLVGGQLRGRTGQSWDRWGASCTDVITHAADGLQDVGDDVPVDFAVVAAKRPNPLLKPHANVREGGALMVLGAGTDSAIWQGLSAETRAAVKQKNLDLYAVMPRSKGDKIPGVAASDLSREHLLGALFKALLDAERVDIKARRLIPAREEALDSLPAHESGALLASFQTGMAAVRKIEYSALTAPMDAPTRSDKAPMAVSQLKSKGDRYDSLPRFWDQVGVLYKNGQSDNQTADPYITAGTVPPLTSTFRDLSDTRRMLPEFDPTDCSGCGACWTSCPDGAIGAVAVTPGALIDAGIKLAGGDTLRPNSSKLAGRICSQVRTGKASSGTAGKLLEEAYAWLQEKMSLPEDRKQAMDDAFNAVNARIGSLPVAVTEPFFSGLEADKKDSGALLALAVNPNACKNCGICISVCEPGAMKAEKQDDARLQRARETWETWGATPDTSSELIERVSSNPEVGSMAAVMLSRFCAMAVAGGDGAESGSGEKAAVRMALAATEYQQQPLLHSFTKDVAETLQQLKDEIRETLASALPVKNLDAMAADLDQVKDGIVDVGELVSQLETTVEEGNVNAVHLRRLVNLAKALAELHWHLAEGKSGLGRARFGLAIAPGTVAAWAGAYPNNPFQVPVAVDTTGDTAQMAAGLLAGQLRESTEAQRLVRLAKLELEQPTGIQQLRADLDTLSWQDLTEQERALCPPLLLVGNDEALAGRGFSQIAWLLKSKLPVKILVLADLGLGVDDGGFSKAPLAASRDPKADLGLMAMAQRGAYVAQTSVAAADHFRQSVREALKYTGPALIHVHVPSPGRHGFSVNQTMQQAELALNSRAFPLFRYNPEGEGVFGSRITLEGNPEPETAWVANEDGTLFTPAQWALTERRFAARFAPITNGDPAPIALDVWLGLDSSARHGKTPFISVTEEGGEVERIRVDAALAAEIAELGQTWQTLQELAGVKTPFADAIEQATEERVAQQHDAVLVELKSEHQQQASAQQIGAQAEASASVRAQLLKIAGY